MQFSFLIKIMCIFIPSQSTFKIPHLQVQTCIAMYDLQATCNLLGIFIVDTWRLHVGRCLSFHAHGLLREIKPTGISSSFGEHLDILEFYSLPNCEDGP